MIQSNELYYRTRLDENGNASNFETKRKFFISYRKKDNHYNLVYQFTDMVLDAVDCAVWYDVGLTAGENYDEEICTALKECDAVILLLTSNVLESQYIWDVEIKLALQYKKGIIPIGLGLSPEHYSKVNEVIGNLHILPAEYVFSKDSDASDRSKFINDLRRTLHRYIASQDISKQVISFFASRKNDLPMKALTVEQIYYMAYGMLNGIGTEESAESALSILESLISIYCTDSETVILKGEISNILMLYLLKIGNIEKALEYGKKSISFGCIKSSNYLSRLYFQGDLVEHNTTIGYGYLQYGLNAEDIEAIQYYIERKEYENSGYSSRINFEELLPYYLKAATHGNGVDILKLIRAYWNLGDKEKAFDFINGNQFKKHFQDSQFIVEAFNFNFNNGDNLGIVSCNYKSNADFGELFTEIVFKGAQYRFFKKRTGALQCAVYLVNEQNGVIFKDKNCFGFGEAPSYDLCIENGYLTIKYADFDHYGPETDIHTYYYLNPSSKDILIISNTEYGLRGRRNLPYVIYYSGEM